MRGRGGEGAREGQETMGGGQSSQGCFGAMIYGWSGLAFSS